MLAEVRGHRVQRMRSQHIVVIDEADEIPGGELESRSSRQPRCHPALRDGRRARADPRRRARAPTAHAAALTRHPRCTARDARMPGRAPSGSPRRSHSRCGIVHRHDEAEDRRVDASRPRRHASCAGHRRDGVCSASQRRYCARRAAAVSATPMARRKVALAAYARSQRRRSVVEQRCVRDAAVCRLCWRRDSRGDEPPHPAHRRLGDPSR